MELDKSNRDFWEKVFIEELKNQKADVRLAALVADSALQAWMERWGKY